MVELEYFRVKEVQTYSISLKCWFLWTTGDSLGSSRCYCFTHFTSLACV
jgi:hypothetical protein